ncbi:MAG: DUF4258 domain-containing protein [Pseudomonadota bacterium]
MLDALHGGQVGFSKHAMEEMNNDDLTTVDIANVIRGGTVDEAEWENGNWRHRVRTARIETVVAFRSDTALVVVTAWRRQ